MIKERDQRIGQMTDYEVRLYARHKRSNRTRACHCLGQAVAEPLQNHVYLELGVSMWMVLSVLCQGFREEQT